MEGLGLSALKGASFGVGAFGADGALLGCCQMKDGFVQGICIDRAAQSEGLMAPLLGALMHRARARGIHSVQVITKPEVAAQFHALGFRRIAGAEPHSVYMEFGRGDAEAERERFKCAAKDKPPVRGAVVLNANPFTKGHLYLIERAASQTPWIFALVVSEEASEFLAADRLKMVREGTAHLGNVSVLPAGNYVVSKRTFPAYFTHEQDLAPAQGGLDAAVFVEWVAPALGVSRRYVGTEPNNPTTKAYNDALKARLPLNGIEVIELPRMALANEVVSATSVRDALVAGDLSRAKALVPPATAAFFETEAGRRAIARLKGLAAP